MKAIKKVNDTLIKKKCTKLNAQASQASLVTFIPFVAKPRLRSTKLKNLHPL